MGTCVLQYSSMFEFFISESALIRSQTTFFCLFTNKNTWGLPGCSAGSGRPPYNHHHIHRDKNIYDKKKHYQPHSTPPPPPKKKTKKKQKRIPTMLQMEVLMARNRSCELLLQRSPCQRLQGSYISSFLCKSNLTKS